MCLERSWTLGFRSYCVAPAGLEGGMALLVNFTCTQGAWVTHLERIASGKQVRFLFLARWIHILFLLEQWWYATWLWRHTAPRMALPQDCECHSSVSDHTGFFTLAQPVGIPEGSRLNWLSSKSPEAQLQSGNLVSKGNYWCYNA